MQVQFRASIVEVDMYDVDVDVALSPSMSLLLPPSLLLVSEPRKMVLLKTNVVME